MSSSDEFSKIFRQEHRQIRDALLDLVSAFQERNREQIGSLLNTVAKLTGPHFRYEEEALYPSLVEFYGNEYVEQLFGDHDRAIGIATSLVALSKKEHLSDDDVTQAITYIRRVLPHVTDCDGLSLMVEKMAQSKVDAIFDARDHALSDDLDLITWTETKRGRKPIMP